MITNINDKKTARSGRAGMHRPTKWIGALLALLIGCASIACAQEINLIQNGTFERYDSLFNLEGWTLPDSAAGVTPALQPGSGYGDVVLQFGDAVAQPDVVASDPSGIVPQIASTLIELPVLPIGAPPTRMVFQAQVSRLAPSGELAPWWIQLTSLDPALPTQTMMLNPEPQFLAPDGRFSAVVGSLPLPPFFSGPVDVQIVKQGPGQLSVDGVRLHLEPERFQVQPDRGTAGMPVEVIGPELHPEAFVFFGDLPAEVMQREPGRLVVVSPPQSVMGPVTVRVESQGQQISRAGGFTYAEPLRAEGLLPRFAPPSGGTTLQLQGIGFVPGMIAVIDNAEIPVRVTSPFEATLPLPPLPPGAHPVLVVGPFGESLWLPEPLMIVEPPRVFGIDPTQGPSAGGTEVVIQGDGFSPESTVHFGDEPAAEVRFVSPDRIVAVTPRNLPLTLDVRVASVEGVEGVLENGFTFEQAIPGDVNNDQILNLHDVMLSLAVSAGQEPSVELDVASDANGDGWIGVEEALVAFEGAGASEPLGFDVLPLPRLMVQEPVVVEGAPVVVSVENMDYMVPGRIGWGDGFFDDINEAGVYLHVYDSPGTRQVVVLTEAGRTEPVTVTVAPTQTLRVLDLSLSMSGLDRNGNAITSRWAQITPDAPPTVQLTVVAEGSGVFEGEVRIEVAAEDDVQIPVRAVFDDGEGVQTQTVQIELRQLNLEGEYFITVPGGPGIPAGLGHPGPLMLQVAGYVTEEDCREIEEQWQAKVAEKEAKKKDCCELEDKIQDLEDQKNALEAERQARENQRAELEQEKADKQDEFDELFEYIDDFLGGSGDLVQYESSADFPAGNHVGARRGGASSGVGIAFGSAQSLLNKFDLYKQVNGHSIGRDLNRLRELISEIDDLSDQIDGLTEEIDDLSGEIDDLCDQIDDFKQQLEDCKKECAELETEIQDLADAHKECLEQLEKQREAEEDIEDASDAGDDAQSGADANNDAADKADEFIGGRSGTPWDSQDDEEEVQEGRDCTAAAQELINRGRKKEQEARDALANGDTATAMEKAAEAKALYEGAQEKLDAAGEHIRTGRSRAARRKPRQCEDGEVRSGYTYTWKVWNEIVDIALVPLGTKPEKWASALENGQGVIDGLKKLLFIVDNAGPASPIAGPVTPDAGNVAEGIVNAHIELFKQRFPFDVYLKVRGHSHWSRVDQVCVNGRWENRTYEGVDEEVCEETIKIGTIWGGDRQSREKQLKKILERFCRSSRFQR